MKPAVFLKVGEYEYSTWSQRVWLEAMRWEWHPPNPYVVFRMSMFFRDPEGGRLGVGARGQVTDTTFELDQYSHQLVCVALFDPTLRDHVDRITTLVQAPGPPDVADVVRRTLPDRGGRTTADLSQPLAHAAGAARALRDGDVRVGSLAVELGYASESAFSAAFARWAARAARHRQRKGRRTRLCVCVAKGDDLGGVGSPARGMRR
ncbi:hypothetical protein OHA25_15070 [Nonomuraea sp. NBC_00507]|uniref:hypothetical protein n=1 Tax=Nonomuraea sp. NBC_00507 TaxID=2976002 RepID=UPI002E187795